MVTLFGIVIDARLLQPSNALLPILATLLGIDMDFKLVQLQKALFPIVVTVLGMTKSVISFSFRYKSCALYKGFAIKPSKLIAHQDVKSEINTDFKLLQLPKAFAPMDFTLLGIVTEVKDGHHQNTYSPMLVTLLGMAIEAKLK